MSVEKAVQIAKHSGKVKALQVLWISDEFLLDAVLFSELTQPRTNASFEERCEYVRQALGIFAREEYAELLIAINPQIRYERYGEKFVPKAWRAEFVYWDYPEATVNQRTIPVMDRNLRRVGRLEGASAFMEESSSVGKAASKGKQVRKHVRADSAQEARTSNGRGSVAVEGGQADELACTGATGRAVLYPRR